MDSIDVPTVVTRASSLGIQDGFTNMTGVNGNDRDGYNY